jgi:hypothetical protein
VSSMDDSDVGGKGCKREVLLLNSRYVVSQHLLLEGLRRSLGQGSLYLSRNLNTLLHKCKSAVLLELPHSVNILNARFMMYMICTLAKHK